MTVIKMLTMGVVPLMAVTCLAGSPVSVMLQNVRWQTLPDEIRSVVVGPDQRVWYELGNDDQQAQPETLCAEIAREFQQANPRLKGIEPVLFEPGGRVWFRWQLSRLVGYDGTNCVEHAADGGRGFMGTCDNHGGATKAVNLAVAGTDFFPDQTGVDTFDGASWSYLSMGNESEGQNTYPILRVEQDGRGVIACHPHGDSLLWRWRDGHWATLPLPPAIQFEITDFAPIGRDAAASVLLFGKSNTVLMLHLGKPEPEDVAALIAQLAAPEFSQREAATRALLRKGTAIRPQLEAAREQNHDPEVQSRIDQVLQESTAGADRSVTIAGYRLTTPRLCYYSEKGTLYLAAESIDNGDGNLAGGLLILDNQGEISLWRGDEFRTGWQSRMAGSGPVFTQPDHQVWLISNPDLPPRLLDLDHGKFIDTLPENNHRWAFAGLTNGTLFVSSQPATAFGTGNVAVYQPHAPDTCEILPTTVLKLTSDSKGVCAVTPDGSIWAEAPDRGLVRYDGKDWQPLNIPIDIHGLRGLIPGHSNEMVAVFQNKCVFLKDQRLVRNDRLGALVQENRDLCAAAFRDGRMGIANHPVPDGIVVDAGSNIWVVSGQKLQVLINDSLWEATEPLKAAGSEDGNVNYLAPLDQRQRVYLTDGQGLFAVYGQVVDGKLDFTPAPAVHELEPLYQAGRDIFGTVWLPYTGKIEQSDQTFSDFGRSAMRLTEDGIVSKVINQGWAQFSDRAGNIWLGNNLKTSRAAYQVWNEGAAPVAVTIPGGQGPTLFASDQPGSVYVITSAGLCHYTVGRGEQPNHYELRHRYQLENLKGTPERFYYSTHGWLVVQTALKREDNSTDYFLYLVRLPTGPQK